jgi:hypothetical protein
VSNTLFQQDKIWTDWNDRCEGQQHLVSGHVCCKHSAIHHNATDWNNRSLLWQLMSQQQGDQTAVQRKTRRAEWKVRRENVKRNEEKSQSKDTKSINLTEQIHSSETNSHSNGQEILIFLFNLVFHYCVHMIEQLDCILSQLSLNLHSLFL